MAAGGNFFCGLVLTLTLAGCVPKEMTGPVPSMENTDTESLESAGVEGTTSVIGGSTEALVTTGYHLEYDSPDRYRLDITLPFLREDLPGAEEVNGQIKADYAGYLGMEPEVFPYEEQGFDYPLVHIYYEAYRFGHLLELVVRYQCYSLYGSGLSSYNTVYCYDTKGETLCSVTRLMEQLEISEKDVVNRYMEFYMMEDTRQDPLAFDMLAGQFFFDGEGMIQIEANQ